MADPAFPASLVDLPEPELPGPAWARVAVDGGRHLRERPPPLRAQRRPVADFGVDGSRSRSCSATRSPAASSKPGPACPHPVGTRVVRRPVHPVRGAWHRPAVRELRARLDFFVPQARQPRRQQRAHARIHPEPRGGWADQVLAHTSMLHPIPDRSPTGARACTSRFRSRATASCARPPTDGEPVLVVGAGIIGLATVAALKGLFPACPVTVLARHAHQADGRGRVRRRPRRAHRGRERALRGARPDLGRARRRSQGERDADGRLPLRGRGRRRAPVGHRGAARGRAPRHRADARRDRRDRGRSHTGLVQGGRARSGRSTTRRRRCRARSRGRPGRHSVDRAIDILAAGLLPYDVVVTHEFPLDDYRTAIETAIDRGTSHAIKVVFRP